MSNPNDDRDAEIAKLLDEARAKLHEGAADETTSQRPRELDAADDVGGLLETVQELEAAVSDWKATADIPFPELSGPEPDFDGILLWDEEPILLFRTNPHGSAADFGKALADSAGFGPPRISGAWRWYPTIRTTEN